MELGIRGFFYSGSQMCLVGFESCLFLMQVLCSVVLVRQTQSFMYSEAESIEELKKAAKRLSHDQHFRETVYQIMTSHKDAALGNKK